MMFNVLIAMHVSIIVLSNLLKSNHLLKKMEDTPIHMQHQMILPDKKCFWTDSRLHPFSSSAAAPFRSLYPGAPSRSAPPALVVWELAGAFRLNRRFGDLKLDVMPVSAGADVSGALWEAACKIREEIDALKYKDTYHLYSCNNSLMFLKTN
jgi:hypothetical protein